MPRIEEFGKSRQSIEYGEGMYSCSYGWNKLGLCSCTACWAQYKQYVWQVTYIYPGLSFTVDVTKRLRRKVRMLHYGIRWGLVGHNVHRNSVYIGLVWSTTLGIFYTEPNMLYRGLWTSQFIQFLQSQGNTCLHHINSYSNEAATGVP